MNNQSWEDIKVLDGTGEVFSTTIAKNTASYALFGRCVYENIKNQ